MRNPADHWFPAKTFGWGWGPPRRWQGWAVIVAWMVAVAVTSVQLAGDPGLVLLATLGWTGVLIAVCFWKGEPPGPSYRGHE